MAERPEVTIEAMAGGTRDANATAQDGEPLRVKAEGTAFASERRLLHAIEAYLPADDVCDVRSVLAYVRELRAAGGQQDEDGARTQERMQERTQERGDEVAGEAGGRAKAMRAGDGKAVGEARETARWDPDDLGYALAVAETLADAIHIDTVSLAAVLLYQAVENGFISEDAVRQRLGGMYGAAVAETIEHIARFDTLQRPRAQLRRRANAAQSAAAQDMSRERRRSRERQKSQDAESLRKMFVAMAEDPRVAVFKIADQLRMMRLARASADSQRLREGLPSSHGASDDGEVSVAAATAHATSAEGVEGAAPRAEGVWTGDTRHALAEETREIFAPLAGRLGMGRVESELEDLAFAILEPEEYRRLSDDVAQYISERGSYVERVCAILRDEMRAIGLRVEVSGRIKHLSSIYKKVQRSGTHDLATLYDIIAFRVLVISADAHEGERYEAEDPRAVADCYKALGYIHSLWRPKEGRIKDFIANPKTNGYQSLHTTVFCLDERLAEIQIRTMRMHEMAEYGVATHWYYKAEGDDAAEGTPQQQDERRRALLRATAGAPAKEPARELAKEPAREPAKERVTRDSGGPALQQRKVSPLQGWVQRVQEWQQELQGGRRSTAERALEAVKNEALKEQIFVFTPAGDVKELPAGATPLDFAYLVHTDLGNQVAGARIQTSDGSGKLTQRLVPLDYELRNGDVIEIIKRKDAHPTRDWLHIARTKTARDKILRYLKAHERDIDIQRGRERLDHEAHTLGLRRGLDELTDDDLEWLATACAMADVESLLAQIGNEKLRGSLFIGKLRERLRSRLPDTEADALPIATTPTREAETTGANVGGMAGMLTRLASCCNPLPGDALMGFITRGRGVVIHRGDCPNLQHLLQRQPERGITVDWPHLSGQETFRAPLIIAAEDRTGLLADVTRVLKDLKINMIAVKTVTRPLQRQAIITATLEIHKPEQLTTAIRELQQVHSVESVERRKPHNDKQGGHARTS